MTDRELLELAAKPTGLRILFDGNHGVFRDCTKAHPVSNFFHAPMWNPLTDDGDALRLAVKLAIEVVPDANGGRAYKGTQCFKEESDGRCAATRRAIVRAAAEIGKAMP